MTNAMTSDRHTADPETLLERVSTLMETTEEMRGEMRKIREEIDAVLAEVRSLPHGNEWARHG